MASHYTIVDSNQWYRKKQYEFFKNYDDPCFNVTVPVDVTKLHVYCKKHNYSFFLTSLFFAQQSINAVEELRLRLIDGQIRLYDTIDVGCTILREDQTFGFAYFKYSDHIEEYLSQGQIIVQRSREGEDFIARDEDYDLVHCSTLPWISFTSFKHARNSSKNLSIPKLVFGKYFEANNQIQMPISIEVMHALADGIHVSKFYTHLHKLIDDL